MEQNDVLRTDCPIATLLVLYTACLQYPHTGASIPSSYQETPEMRAYTN